MLLYADEDFPLPAVQELRRHGHDVLTAQEDGQIGRFEGWRQANTTAKVARPALLPDAVQWCVLG